MVTTRLSNAIASNISQIRAELADFGQEIEQYLMFIAKAAEGNLAKNPANIQRVEEAVNALNDYFKQMLGVGKYNFDDSFWKDAETAEYAALISRAECWLMGDDLITMAEAAFILKGVKPEDYRKKGSAGARVFMSNKINNLNSNTGVPFLKLYWIPGEKNPMRVSRVEVEALHNQTSR